MAPNASPSPDPSDMERGDSPISTVSKNVEMLNIGGVLRPPMNQEEFEAEYKYHHPQEENELKRQTKKFLSKYKEPFTSCAAFRYALTCFFPIIEWLPDYPKNFLANDLVGGFTMGVMHVPQGIAYAILAKVPPVVGLYVSFFPPLFYMFMGTSRHSSLGSFSVSSLMCGLAVTRLTEVDNGNGTITSTGVDPIHVATTLTFIVGIMQILMGVLRLDFMTTYFSDQVVAGFTTGASMHVFVSQLKDAFGLRGLTRRTGAGYLVMTLNDIGSHITETNLVAFGIFLSSFLFILLGKEVVAPLITKHVCKSAVPIPYELIVIVLTIIGSWYFNIAENYNVKVVGDLPTGFPPITVPHFDLIDDLLWDGLAIAVVVVAVHLSLSKMFAKKLNYECDANQELYAVGVSSAASAFFSVCPVSCSLGRTLLNVDVGTKTLLSNAVSSAVLLSIMLYLGQFFATLPNSVLSAVVIVALKSMLHKFKELRLLWPISKIDFSIWVVSFLATTFIDVTPGLAISIIYALFTTIMREQWPRWHLLGNLGGTTDFRDSERYEDVYFYHGICIFRFDSPLLFTNVDRFKKTVVKAQNSWERSHEYYVFRVERTMMLRETDENGEQKHDILEESEALSRHFIIDCSGFTFVDYMGVSALKEVYAEMRARGVLVYFANAKAPVRELFESCGFYDVVSKENFYPTIRDAVSIAQLRQKARGQQDVSPYVLEHDRLSELISSQPLD